MNTRWLQANTLTKINDNATTYYMYQSQISTKDTSPASELGDALRQARQKQGLTIAQLAELIGRPREWLNRVELGYSMYGEHRPPTAPDLVNMVQVLSESLTIDASKLEHWRQLAEADFDAAKQSSSPRRKRAGKVIQAEVIIGEDQICQAIISLINEQHSEAVIRNTGIKGVRSYVRLSEAWKPYREALGEFLNKNPNGLMKRVEYAPSVEQLELAKQADARLAGTRDLKDTHNAKIKFQLNNPMLLHMLIGQREAILALPQPGGQSGSSMALMVRDKAFVEALRVWYDEVLWEGAGPAKVVDFARFDESFEEIKQMYGFNQPPTKN
jgi:transcriptional regulator with XRE-family HTH domain